MLKIAAIAMIGAVSALGAVQAMTTFSQASQAPDLRASQAPMAQVAYVEPATASQAASVPKSADGHYWAEAQVNNSRIRFLVDTGATTVALTAVDAEWLGFTPKTLDYSQSVMTANGETRAAKIVLTSVSVAGARMADVDALVIEKGLDTSLLGMTYLGRLSRFEATKTALILRP